MSNFLRCIYGFVIVLSSATLTACGTADSPLTTNHVSEASKAESPLLANTAKVPFSTGDWEGYIDYIAELPDFQPYYKTVFAFETLPNGIASVPLEKVKTMYQELNSTFDYIAISEQPLFYRGQYTGATNFVQGYDQYESADPSLKISNPINTVGQGWDGNQIITTPLKTVMLGEGVAPIFDNAIAEGRNFQPSDFVLSKSTEPISVILGSEYRNAYKIGDTFSLELISEVMEFKVVGFYKANTNFSMDVGARHQVDLDYAIVVPYFIPNYKPIGEAATFQHAYLLAEMTSGYIALTESVSEITDDTHAHYADALEKMAARNGLSGLYKYPYWPVGFLWQKA